MADNFLTLPGVTYMGLTKAFTHTGIAMIVGAVISLMLFVGLLIAMIKTDEEVFIPCMMVSAISLAIFRIDCRHWRQTRHVRGYKSRWVV